MRLAKAVTAACAILVLCALHADASETAIFGPKTYANPTGKPQPVTDTFRVDPNSTCNGKATFTLVVANNGISSASISLNETVVARENDFAVPRTNFEAAVTPKMGTNMLTVTIKGGQRDGSIRLSVIRRLTVGCGPTVAFTSPAEGERVMTAMILVTGTATGPKDVAVTVNGIVAGLDLSAGGTNSDPFRWLVQIPANAGDVTLRAIATTAASTRAEATRRVVSQPAASSIRFSSHPQSGTAPLIAQFNVHHDEGAPVSQYEADFDADGVADWSADTLPDLLSFTYQAPGIYLATLRARTTAGEIVVAKTPVVVQAFAAADALLRASWSRFSTALAAQDVTAALNEMSPSAVEKYRDSLETILPELPAYVSSITGFDPVWIGERAAHYLLRRRQADRVFGYHIYFTRGADGVWKLTQF